MKHMIRIAAFAISVLFILSLCACSEGSVDPECCGKYTAFGISQEGEVSSLGSKTHVEMTLNEDGTGEMKMKTSEKDSEGKITSWGVKNGKLTIVIEGKKSSGPIKDGVAELLIADSKNTLYFAKEGADTSSYDVK